MWREKIQAVFPFVFFHQKYTLFEILGECNLFFPVSSSKKLSKLTKLTLVFTFHREVLLRL